MLDPATTTIPLRRAGRPLALAALVLLLAGCGEPGGPTCVARATAPIVLAGLDGEPVRPLEEAAAASAIVFLFARSDCPISNRYAPEVRRIFEEYSPRGVRFRLVYLDRDESAPAIRAHSQEYGYPFAALRDPRHELVELTGATVTPEAAVFLPDGCMVYRGRIDDRYVDFGRSRAAATRHDLEEALSAVLAGRRIDEPTTQAVGCYIPDLR